MKPGNQYLDDILPKETTIVQICECPLGTEGVNMEYGKAFGVGTTGGVALFGLSIGYGWIVAGAIVATIGLIVGIRYFFRRNRSLGGK